MLLALLRYGTATTKRAVLEQLRDQELLRSLICLGAEITQERWLPANVGTNLLLILRDLIYMPLEQLEEEPSMLVLYDMACGLLRSCMRLLEPKLTEAIEAGPLHGGQVRPFSAQEEMLMQQVAIVYQTIATALSAVTLAEDPNVDGASHELALQLLMPVGHVRALLKYLYYDMLLTYGKWGADYDDAAADGRARTVSALTRLLVEHLCGNEDTRWEVLEIFARYETTYKLALRPSYVQTLLDLVRRRMYEEALEPHLLGRRIFPEQASAAPCRRAASTSEPRRRTRGLRCPDPDVARPPPPLAACSGARAHRLVGAHGVAGQQVAATRHHQPRVLLAQAAARQEVHRV